LGWGHEHVVIALIAEHYMTPGALTRPVNLLDGQYRLAFLPNPLRPGTIAIRPAPRGLESRITPPGRRLAQR
jgi:hypothetical protein